jgi:hypothetical protein
VLRFFLIALGVLSPLVCAGATILTWQHDERPPYLLLIQIAFSLAVFAIGWRAYPYWANGIYHAFQEAGSMQSLYDPKALAPFHWVGVGVGSLMVLLTLLLIEFTVILVAGIAVLLEALRRGLVSATGRNVRHSTATSTWFFSAMIILVPLLIMLVIQFVLTPGYATWIAD